MKFTVSRWKLWWGYLAVFVLAMFAVWLTDRGSDVVSWVVTIFTALAVLALEMAVRSEHVTITGGHLVYKSGIFSKSTVRLPVSEISSVSVHQPVHRVLMHCGVVKISAGQQTITLNCFKDPNKIERALR